DAVSAALSISQLGVQRGGRTLVRAVSFDVQPGEIVALIGPNGAGKTTLLEAVVGLGRATGTVRAAPLFWLPDEAAPAAELTVAHQLEIGRALGGSPLARSADYARRLHLDVLMQARCGTL